MAKEGLSERNGKKIPIKQKKEHENEIVKENY